MPSRPSRRRVLRAASVGLGSTVAGCLSSFMAEEPEKPERSENAPPLKWISDVQRYPWQSPTIHDGTIYCASDFYVSAVDDTDGSERWHYEIDTPNDSTCYSGKIGVADGTVYTAGCDEVYAFDTIGEIQWAVDDERSGSQPTTVPAISESALFIGGYNLVRRDRATGAPAWGTNITGATRATPVLGEDLVFVGASSGQLEGFDRASGERRVAVDTKTDHASAPVIEDGIVYVGTAVFSDEEDSTGYLYAIDIEKQRRLWRVKTGAILNNLSPAIHDDTVFVISDTGDLYGIAMADGTVRWTYDAGVEHAAAPRVGDGLVYVSGGDKVQAVDVDTGERRWHISWSETTVNGRDSPPLVTSDGLYIGASYRLYAFDLS